MLPSAARRERLDLELLRRYHREHDLQARDELVARMLPFVRSLARRFVGRGEPFDDLVQVGALGLVQAIDRFDLAAGGRFVSFAAPTITGEMQRHFRDHCWAVHVPRGAQELAARLTAARRDLTDSRGREPRPAVLAAHLGVALHELRDATTAANGYAALSVEAPPGAPESGVLGRRGSTDPGYDRVEDRDAFDRACATLDDRAAAMVRERFVDERLQREIAADHGVCQMQVSRILSRSVESMREELAAYSPT